MSRQSNCLQSETFRQFGVQCALEANLPLQNSWRSHRSHHHIIASKPEWEHELPHHAYTTGQKYGSPIVWTKRSLKGWGLGKFHQLFTKSHHPLLHQMPPESFSPVVATVYLFSIGWSHVFDHWFSQPAVGCLQPSPSKKSENHPGLLRNSMDDQPLGHPRSHRCRRHPSVAIQSLLPNQVKGVNRAEYKCKFGQNVLFNSHRANLWFLGLENCQAVWSSPASVWDNTNSMFRTLHLCVSNKAIILNSRTSVGHRTPT